ncbi:MAG TPA: acetolactate synthase small subunit [Clostridiales bacterium]|nr:acetolactate synthase small subunit [Clostridiales bacterium]
MRQYVLSILVEDNPGVLTRVTGLFSRRGYNIQSLTVGPSQEEGISRITIEVYGDEYVLEQIKKQLAKLVEVTSITELKQGASVYRELLLVKVAANDSNRGTIVEIGNVFRAKVVDICHESIIMEITGEPSKNNAFLDLLSYYGIKEIARTGMTGLERGAVELKRHGKKDKL